MILVPLGTRYRGEPPGLLLTMNVDVIQDQPAPARPGGSREYVQWLTCTSCAVAWIGTWSQEACWCCERADDVRLRWAA